MAGWLGKGDIMRSAAANCQQKLMTLATPLHVTPAEFYVRLFVNLLPSTKYTCSNMHVLERVAMQDLKLRLSTWLITGVRLSMRLYSRLGKLICYSNWHRSGQD